MAIAQIFTTLINEAKKPIEWLINSAPKPFKIILFLFLLIGTAEVFNIVFTNDYSCNLEEGDYILRKNIVSAQSKAYYTNAYVFKINISQIELEVDDDVPESVKNETLKDIQNEYYLARLIAPVITFAGNLKNGFENLFSGDFSAVNPFNLLSGVTNRKTVACDQLYESLDEDIATQLNLFDDCTLDDIPDYSLWRNVTNPTTSGIYNEMFRFRCFNEKVNVTAFGFPFLDFKMWLFLIIVSTIMIMGFRYREWLKLN